MNGGTSSPAVGSACHDRPPRPVHWQTAAVLQHVRLAQDTYRLRLAAPQLAAAILPGQFLMLRLPQRDDPLLARPLALYDTVLDDQGRPQAVDVVYLVVGKMTSRLTQVRPGDRLECWGPLGNGFPPQAAEHLVMVAGGIGQTPFLALAQEHLGRRSYGQPARRVAPVPRISFCYGVRSQAYLAGVDDFRSLGVEVHLSTDDGSYGHPGRVTELLPHVVGQQAASATRLVCCGPEPMMHAVAQWSLERGLACQVSLETPMACGMGICFSCVTRVKDEQGGWDYRRTCVEGPVFDAAALVW